MPTQQIRFSSSIHFFFHQENLLPTEIILLIYVSLGCFVDAVSTHSGREVDQLLMGCDPILSFRIVCSRQVMVLILVPFANLGPQQKSANTVHGPRHIPLLVEDMDAYGDPAVAIWLSIICGYFCVSRAQRGSNGDHTTKPNTLTMWPFAEWGHWLLVHMNQAKVTVEEEKYLASRTVAKTDYSWRAAVSTTHTH